jgi:hypothetical protein
MHPRPSDPFARTLAIFSLSAMLPLPLVVGIIAGAAGADGGRIGVGVFMVSSAVTVAACIVYGIYAAARDRFRYREALADPQRVDHAGPPSLALLARGFVYGLLGLPLGLASFGAYCDSRAGDGGHAFGVAFFFLLSALALSAAGSSLSRYLLHRQAWKESLQEIWVKRQSVSPSGRSPANCGRTDAGHVL